MTNFFCVKDVVVEVDVEHLKVPINLTKTGADLASNDSITTVSQ